MLLKTDLRDYEVEFTFEAAESEIVQTAFDYFSGSYMFKGMSDSGTELEKKMSQMNAMVSGISAMSRFAIDFLYMGLLEHHGPCGDISQDILCRDDAKRIYKQFCKLNPENEMSMQAGLFDVLKGQMEKDGFFERIGLEQMMQAMNQPDQQEESAPITPQDHKKKVQRKSNTKA